MIKIKKMTYHVNIENSKKLASEGEAVETELLLKVLEKSTSEIKDGKSFSLDEVLSKIEKIKN